MVADLVCFNTFSKLSLVSAVQIANRSAATAEIATDQNYKNIAFCSLFRLPNLALFLQTGRIFSDYPRTKEYPNDRAPVCFTIADALPRTAIDEE